MIVICNKYLLWYINASIYFTYNLLSGNKKSYTLSLSIWHSVQPLIGLPWWLSRKESTCNAELQDTEVLSLGQEDLLEEGIAIHSSILAWRIPWTEETGELQSIRSHRIGHEWNDFAHTHASMHNHWYVKNSQWF